MENKSNRTARDFVREFAALIGTQRASPLHNVSLTQPTGKNDAALSLASDLLGENRELSLKINSLTAEVADLNARLSAEIKTLRKDESPTLQSINRSGEYAEPTTAPATATATSDRGEEPAVTETPATETEYERLEKLAWSLGGKHARAFQEYVDAHMGFVAVEEESPAAKVPVATAPVEAPAEPTTGAKVIRVHSVDAKPNGVVEAPARIMTKSEARLIGHSAEKAEGTYEKVDGEYTRLETLARQKGGQHSRNLEAYVRKHNLN